MDINVRTPQRPLHTIAQEIVDDWAKVSPHAKPYLVAMLQLRDMTDDYGNDSAQSVVAYFLANAHHWHGEVARRVKAELKAMLQRVQRSSL